MPEVRTDGPFGAHNNSRIVCCRASLEVFHVGLATARGTVWTR